MEEQNLHKANQGAFSKERVRLPEEQRGHQNLPIDAAVKSRRAYMHEPIDETCWAYMKLLREHSDMKRIYDVDPYAEVYRFRDNLYAIFTESLDGMGDSWMYLIDGPKKAMLIDTSFGLGDLKGLCDEITGGKEIIVVNTHGHYDHAYGNAQFDRVYCHEFEVASLETQDEHIWDYLFQDDGVPIWSDFDRNDLIRFTPYQIIGVPDGYVWDLGDGYEIELIHLGGHTAGHSAFLDRQGRNLFCGDDFLSMRVGITGSRPYLPYREYATVTAFFCQSQQLEERIDEIDHLFPGHFVVDLESTVIHHMVAALRYVLKDPLNNYDFKKEMGGAVSYFKYVDGLGTLSYKEASIV